MMGALSAFLRSNHMRLTTFVARAPPSIQNVLNNLAIVIPAAVMMAALPGAIRYTVGEAAISTPALGWSGAVRASALPTGFALMALASLPRLRREIRLTAINSIIGVAIVAGLLGLGNSVFQSIGNAHTAILFISMLFCLILAGIPIAFAFTGVTVSYLALVANIPLEVVAGRMEEGMSGIILLAVPLFILLGAIIEITGMAAAMVRLFVATLGRLKGGLNYALLGAMLLVSGISGAKAADMAAVAPVLFPEMKRRGESEGEMVSLLAASAAMSETIPPSIVLITIGSVAGVSIAKLFTAGILPALVLAIGLAMVSRLRISTAPGTSAANTASRSAFPLIGPAIPALLLPILIRVAIGRGIATATEVATLAIAYALAVGPLVYRKLQWRNLQTAIADTVALSGMILLIVGAASGMSWAFTVSGFTREITSMMSALPGGQAGFMAASVLVFVLFGSILEGIPAIVLLGPLLFPIAQHLGIHQVHYAIVVVLSMGIGLFSPPLGVGYYTACVIGQVDPGAGLRTIWPYMAMLLIGLLVIAYVPWISIVFLR
jgi:tripartite ATP-independent transporter DctM subunit